MHVADSGQYPSLRPGAFPLHLTQYFMLPLGPCSCMTSLQPHKIGEYGLGHIQT